MVQSYVWARSLSSSTASLRRHCTYLNEYMERSHFRQSRAAQSKQPGVFHFEVFVESLHQRQILWANLACRCIRMSGESNAAFPRTSRSRRTNAEHFAVAVVRQSPVPIQGNLHAYQVWPSGRSVRIALFRHQLPKSVVGQREAGFPRRDPRVEPITCKPLIAECLQCVIDDSRRVDACSEFVHRVLAATSLRTFHLTD